MANYFVLNSKFTPYSFDELIKPYQMYGEEYKRQEDILRSLSENDPTETLPDGSIAKSMYDNAATNLKNVSDQLASRGLNPTLRKDILNISKDYTNTMKTINTAQNKLNEEIDRRLKLGEDYVYQDNDLNIDRYLTGNTPNTKQQSLSNITKTLSTDMAQLAQNMISAPEFSIAKNTSNQYFQIKQKYGLDNADLIYLTTQDSNGNYLWETDPDLPDEIKKQMARRYSPFINAMENKKAEIDYYNYGAPEKEQINSAINEALYAALGKASYDFQTNHEYVDPARRQSMAIQSAQNARQQALFDMQYEKQPDGSYKPRQSFFDTTGKKNPNGSSGSESNSGSGSGNSKSDRSFAGVRVYAPTSIKTKSENTDGKKVKTEQSLGKLSRTYDSMSKVFEDNSNKNIKLVPINTYEDYISIIPKEVRQTMEYDLFGNTENTIIPGSQSSSIQQEYNDNSNIIAGEKNIFKNYWNNNYLIKYDPKTKEVYVESPKSQISATTEQYNEDDLGFTFNSIPVEWVE